MSTKREDIPVDSSSVRWYMNELNLSPDELKRKSGISFKKIEAILTDDDSAGLTFRQLGTVSVILETTSTALLIPPPDRSEMPESADFRRNSHEPLSYTFKRELKRISRYRSSYLELAGDKAKKPKILAGFVRENLEDVAKSARSRLFGNEERLPFNELMSRFEDFGILVFQTPRIERTEYRGYSAYYDLAPIIAINSKDSANGKVFTLCHELGHLMNRSSGLCSVYENYAAEVLCNRFAASLLMPKDLVFKYKKDDVRSWISAVSTRLGVSEHAAAIRLNEFGRASDEDVQRAKEESDYRYEKMRKKQRESDGGPESWKTKISQLGKAYPTAVLGAVDEGRITTVDATYMLNTKSKTLKSMQDALGFDGGLF